MSESPAVPKWSELGVPEDDHAEPKDADTDHSGPNKVEGEPE